MKIDLSCAQCGGNNFSLDEEKTDDCRIKCGDCGHNVGTLGELKQRVAEAVLGGPARTPPPRQVRRRA